MGKKWIIAGVLLWWGWGLGGCGAGRWQVKETEKYVGNELLRISRIGEKEREVVRDTVRMVEAPVEKSRNVGEDSSFLKTSLAWSLAVWREGRLCHTIGNYPLRPVPVRTIYRERRQTVYDTLMIRDTLYLGERQTEQRETGRSAWDRWWGMSGKIMMIIIAGYWAWRKFRTR